MMCIMCMMSDMDILINCIMRLRHIYSISLPASFFDIVYIYLWMYTTARTTRTVDLHHAGVETRDLLSVTGQGWTDVNMACLLYLV